jgi:hypothetical protein
LNAVADANSDGGGGGLGDRLRGLLGVFLYCMQHDYGFFAKITTPSALELHFAPAMVDWRHNADVIPSRYRVTKAMLPNTCAKQREVLEHAASDQPFIQGFLTNHYPLICMFNFSRPLMAYKEMYDRVNAGRGNVDKFGTSSTEDSPPLESDQVLAEERGMDEMRSPAAEAWRMLFEPRPVLKELYENFRKVAGLAFDEPYIGIHLRTGLDYDNDPDRMRVEAIVPSFECVLRMEAALGLARHTRWVLASDYGKAFGLARDFLAAQGLDASKVVNIAMINGTAVHTGKTGQSDDAHVGDQFVYLDFLLLRAALVVCGNDSGFNRMAAAIGDHERRMVLPQCTELPVPY